MTGGFLVASSSSSSSSSEPTSWVDGTGIVGVSTAGGGLAFLFLFFFYAVFTIVTLAAAVEADCFASAALVLRLDFRALLAFGLVCASPPTSGSVSSSASTDESVDGEIPST
jgi:hypothetical protein